MKTEKPALARIAIPAHFYIAVPMTDDSTDEELIAAAKNRVRELFPQDDIPCPQFQDEECVVVYLDNQTPASVDDRYW